MLENENKSRFSDVDFVFNNSYSFEIIFFKEIKNSYTFEIKKYKSE